MNFLPFLLLLLPLTHCADGNRSPVTDGNPKVTNTYLGHGIYRMDDSERGATCYFARWSSRISCVTQMKVEIGHGVQRVAPPQLQMTPPMPAQPWR